MCLLDQLTCRCNIDLEGKRNGVSSVVAGTLFFIGWWIVLDCALVSEKKDWTNIYLLLCLFSTISFLMVNSVSHAAIRGDTMYDSMLSTKGARLWLMISFCLSFSCLVAAIWILFSDYVLPPGDHPVWPGVALFLNSILIFTSSLVYKFGRTEDLWG